MSVLSKFKVRKDLQQQIEKEDTSSGGNKKDDRFLPYYDLKFGEKVKVIIVPDTEGNIWKKFSAHGPNLKVRGTGTVACRYKNDNEECPICQKGFDLLQQAKDTGDDKYKDEAKRWFAKDTTIMSVLVLESPFDVPISPDQNEVKLMYVPYAIEGLIKNALAEGQLDVDSLLSTPLCIKKTVKKGTKDTPDYTSSYFDYRSPVTDDEMSVFEDSVVEQYDYSDLDVIPQTPSLDDAEEWLEKAVELDERDKARKAKDNGNSGNSSNNNNTPNTKLKSAAERLKEKRAAQSAPTDDDDVAEDDAPDTDTQEESAAETTDAPTETKSRAQQLRERLAAAKRG